MLVDSDQRSSGWNGQSGAMKIALKRPSEPYFVFGLSTSNAKVSPFFLWENSLKQDIEGNESIKILNNIFSEIEKVRLLLY